MNTKVTESADPVEHAFCIARVAREAGFVKNTIANGVIARRNHPSYGYTKTDLKNGLYRLEGLGRAIATMTWGYGGGRWKEALADHGIDWDDLRKRVEAS